LPWGNHWGEGGGGFPSHKDRSRILNRGKEKQGVKRSMTGSRLLANLDYLERTTERGKENLARPPSILEGNWTSLGRPFAFSWDLT